MRKYLPHIVAGIALFSAIAYAANAPTYRDHAGMEQDAQGVVLIDTTGQPYKAASTGGGAITAPLGAGTAAGAVRMTEASDSPLITLLPTALGASGGLKVESQSTNASYTDASIASATGSSQTVAASSATRKYLLIANPGSTTWWINPSGATASANCGGCFEIPPGSIWTPRVPPSNAVTGIGTSTSKLTVVGG